MSQFDVDQIIAEFDEHNIDELDIWDRNTSLFRDVSPTGAFIFLHDCGDSGPGVQALLGHLWGDHETIDFEEMMATLGFVVLFPTGPLRNRYQQDVNSWINRDEITWTSKEEVEDLTMLDTLIEDINNQWNIPLDRIVMGGVGSGGAASLYYSNILKTRTQTTVGHVNHELGGLFVINSFLPTKSSIWENINIVWNKIQSTSSEKESVVDNVDVDIDVKAYKEIDLESESDIDSLSSETDDDEDDDEAEDDDDEEDDDEYDRKQLEKQNRMKRANYLSDQRRKVREERILIRKQKRELKLELIKIENESNSLQRVRAQSLKNENRIFHEAMQKEKEMNRLAAEEKTDLMATHWEPCIINNNVNKTNHEDTSVDPPVKSSCILFLHGEDNLTIPLDWGISTARGFSISNNKVNCLEIEGAGEELNTEMVKYLLSWIKEVVTKRDNFMSVSESNSTEETTDQGEKKGKDNEHKEDIPLLEMDPFKLPFVCHPLSLSSSSSSRKDEFKIIYQVPIGWEIPLSRYPVSACESSFILEQNEEEAGTLSTTVVSTDPKGTAEMIRLRLLQRLNDPNPPGISDCRPS